jgi:UrcA family protein
LNDTVTDALRQIDQPGRAAIESGNWNVLPTGVASGSSGFESDQTDLKVISVAGVDLSTAEGARMAKDQIKKAARHICAQLASQDPSLDSSYGKCVDDATMAALRQVPGPALLAEQQASKARIEVSTQVASK